MEGKIIKFSPKLDAGGNHETYNGTRGLLYKFNMTMLINGTEETGECNSNRADPSWVVGDNYSFERRVQGAQGQYIHYSALKNMSKPFVQKSGNSFSNPIDKLAFAKQKALEAAMHALPVFWADKETLKSYTHKNYVIPAIKMYGHVVRTNIEKDIWLNIAALNSVTEKLEVGLTLENDPDAAKGIKAIDCWIMELDNFRKIFDTILNDDNNVKPN